MTTLQAMRDQLFADACRPKGAHCPLCLRYLKRYHRLLSAGMALVLIQLYKVDKSSGGSFVHVGRYLKSLTSLPEAARADWHKMEHWDLLERDRGGGPNGHPNSGFWRITSLGREFVELKILQPHAVWLDPKNTLINWDSSKMISIKDALGVHFNYTQLMTT